MDFLWVTQRLRLSRPRLNCVVLIVMLTGCLGEHLSSTSNTRVREPSSKILEGLSCVGVVDDFLLGRISLSRWGRLKIAFLRAWLSAVKEMLFEFTLVVPFLEPLDLARLEVLKRLAMLSCVRPCFSHRSVIPEHLPDIGD